MAFIRRNKETLAAAALFLLLALLFMAKTLFPATGQVLGGYDMRGIFNILHETAREAVHNGRMPFWTPYLFNGYPFLANPQTGFFYPLTWPTLIVPVNMAISWYMAFHIWLAGMGMYLFVRAMGGRTLPALLAGCAFAFSGLLAGRLWAGHTVVYGLDAWTPWLTLALLWSVRRGSIWHGILAGIPFAMAILVGHIPSLLYVGLIWALFTLYLLWTETGHRALIIRQAMIMALVGLSLSAVQLLPFLQLSLSSQRVATADFQFATDYSLPPAHLVTLLLPQFFGEPGTIGYWSVPTFEELAYYAGLLPVLTLVLALRRPTRLTWFYLALMIFGLWLALGRYGVLYELAYDYVPIFRLVRAPGRAAFLYLFAATALMGHVLSVWLDVPAEERRESLGHLLRWTVPILVLVGVAALAATGAVFTTIHPTDTSGRLWHQIGGYAQALMLLLIGVGLLWGYLTTPAQDQRRRKVLGVALILLVLADGWLFAYKMVRLEPSSPEAVWTDARAIIDQPDARVLPWGLNIFSQNAALQVKLRSMFGYDPMEPAQHVAFTSAVPDPRSSAYDILGVEYVMANTPLDQFTEGEGGLELAAQQGSAWVYRRPRTLPAVRLAYQVEVIADNGVAASRVHEPDFDSAVSVILDATPPCEVGPVPAVAGQADVLSTEAGSWQIKTESEAPAILLVSENAYPGWQVTVDGEAAESLAAFTTIRGVCVPPGEHLVEWQFVPTIYLPGALLSLTAIILIIVALLQLWRERSRMAVNSH